MKIICLTFFILFFSLVKSQAPDPELLVNIHSATATELPGLLANSAIGSLIYNTTDDVIEVRGLSGWKSLETLTTLIDNADGTYTFTNEKGDTQIIDTKATTTEPILTKTSIGYNFAAGHTAANGTGLYNVNSTVARIATGIYEVRFGNAHPNGDQYPITLGVQQDATALQVKAIQVVSGSQTATSFQINILTGDNGSIPDVLADDIWYFNVVAEIEVVTDVTFDNNTNSTGGTPEGTQTTIFNVGNFADINNFSLGFNSASSVISNWEILISDRPYNALPANTTASVNGNALSFTTSTKDNGDGTFDILITGMSPLPANNQFITFSGAAPSPAGTQFGGSCSCVTFHIN